jgi:hypothetical protein
MLHHERLALVALHLLALSSSLAFAAGPGEAAGHGVQRTAGPVDFKVLVWYRRADPVATFKYEIYDVRKGEYTSKVDDWIETVRTKYPGFYAVVRDVDLSREMGETELLRVGSVISRELNIAATSAGIVFGPRRVDPRPAGYGVFGTAPGASLGRAPGRVRGSVGSQGGDRDFLKPNPTSFPVPVPFPRIPR